MVTNRIVQGWARIARLIAIIVIAISLAMIKNKILCFSLIKQNIKANNLFQFDKRLKKIMIKIFKNEYID